MVEMGTLRIVPTIVVAAILRITSKVEFRIMRDHPLGVPARTEQVKEK